MLFMQNEVKLATPDKALHDPWESLYLGSWRVSLAEYNLVLRVYFPLVADGNMYCGYCKHCFYLAVDDE
jgi:hypothetical protein